jgi:hypothetical protein
MRKKTWLESITEPSVYELNHKLGPYDEILRNSLWFRHCGRPMVVVQSYYTDRQNRLCAGAKRRYCQKCSIATVPSD